MSSAVVPHPERRAYWIAPAADHVVPRVSEGEGSAAAAGEGNRGRQPKICVTEMLHTVFLVGKHKAEDEKEDDEGPTVAPDAEANNKADATNTGDAAVKKVSRGFQRRQEEEGVIASAMALLTPQSFAHAASTPSELAQVTVTRGDNEDKTAEAVVGETTSSSAELSLLACGSYVWEDTTLREVLETHLALSPALYRTLITDNTHCQKREEEEEDQQQQQQQAEGEPPAKMARTEGTEEAVPDRDAIIDAAVLPPPPSVKRPERRRRIDRSGNTVKVFLASARHPTGESADGESTKTKEHVRLNFVASLKLVVPPMTHSSGVPASFFSGGDRLTISDLKNNRRWQMRRGDALVFYTEPKTD